MPGHINSLDILYTVQTPDGPKHTRHHLYNMREHLQHDRVQEPPPGHQAASPGDASNQLPPPPAAGNRIAAPAGASAGTPVAAGLIAGIITWPAPAARADRAPPPGR